MLTLQDGLAKEQVTIMIFAISYNVLRFREGLGGLNKRWLNMTNKETLGMEPFFYVGEKMTKQQPLTAKVSWSDVAVRHERDNRHLHDLG